MFDTPPDYRERADMHELLAHTTGDGAARAMHRAMAAEYRRKAEEAGVASPPMPAASLAA